MRPIKFRAWDKDLKRMWYFDKYWYCDEYNSISFKLNKIQMDECPSTYVALGSIGSDANFELMQFTGLADKNGKEIYEGDLFRHSVTGAICTVKYADAAFGIKGDGVSQYLCYDAEHGEVVGNVYQDSHLIA